MDLTSVSFWHVLIRKLTSGLGFLEPSFNPVFALIFLIRLSFIGV